MPITKQLMDPRSGDLIWIDDESGDIQRGLYLVVRNAASGYVVGALVVGGSEVMVPPGVIASACRFDEGVDLMTFTAPCGKKQRSAVDVIRARK